MTMQPADDQPAGDWRDHSALTITARDPHADCGHDDEDDREVVAPGDQDHDWPGPKGPF